MVLCVVAFSSCVSDIDIEGSDQDPLYVIEGWIEQDGFPHVLVTQTTPYNSIIGLADLFEVIVTDAQVTLRTDNEEEMLTQVRDTMYTVIPIYRGFRIKGEIGKAYTLEVRVGDHFFTSTDTMRSPVSPDSLWFIAEPGKEGGGVIHLSLTDPEEKGNYYRFVAKRLNKDDDYLNLSGNILDDHLFNGKTIHFPLIRSGSNIQDLEGGFFYPGQIVVVKTCMINADRFLYLSSVSNQVGSTLSPLSIQTRTSSLFEGGALGSWACFGVSLDTLIIEDSGI